METIQNRDYEGIPIGLAVRGSINNELTWRVRRGNGWWGSLFGKFYQDRFTYTIPSSINNPEGEASRVAFAQAVLNWQTVLTAEQKADFNRRANIVNTLSGYNLYIGEYVKANA